MERPLLKAAGVAAGTLFIAIGISAQLGGSHLFAPPHQGRTASQAAPPAQPSPQASPSPQPEMDAVTADGTIYAGSQGGDKKKHSKGR